MVDVGRQYGGHYDSLAVDDLCPPSSQLDCPERGIATTQRALLILRLQIPVWFDDAHLLRPH